MLRYFLLALYAFISRTAALMYGATSVMVAKESQFADLFEVSKLEAKSTYDPSESRFLQKAMVNFVS